jgi:tyrosyl-tRNA synthetase
LIIGNYTALVGDPSGRDQTRVRLTPETIETNARDYLKQVSKVIDINQTEVRYNGEWFSRFNFLDLVGLTSKITMQRMLERDDFTKRLKADKPIYLHECLYPLMQGRDSVEIHADVELGGSEQLFSLMVGRDLQRDAGQEPQVCVTLPILRGLDGVRRMGKSLGNHVGVAEPPYDMLAKTMSIPDDLMRDWFELLTDRPQEEIARLTDPELGNPRDAKITLGKDIVTFYYGTQAAEDAANEWRKRNTEKQDPSEIAEVAIAAAEAENGQIWICKLLKLVKLANGTNEARRHVQGGAVTIGPDREKITEPTANVGLVDGLVVRVGNRRIVRVKLG